MTASATTQAGLDASVSSFVKTLMDDANSAELCKTLGVPGPDGWIDDTGETWTYVSTDAPTFVFSVNADVTAKYSVGQRIKLTQTTVKYFIITAVGVYGAGVTNITVYGGTDYTLVSAAISANYHSYVKAPKSFPMDPAKWTVEITSVVNTVVTTPTDSVWYGGSGLSPTGPSIDIPIGAWMLSYLGTLGMVKAGAISAECSATLSTANNSASDSSMTSYNLHQNSGSTITGFRMSITKSRLLTLAAKTTYYLNYMGLTATSGGFYGSNAATILRAVCAYL